MVSNVSFLKVSKAKNVIVKGMRDFT